MFVQLLYLGLEGLQQPLLFFIRFNARIFGGLQTETEILRAEAGNPVPGALGPHHHTALLFGIQVELRQNAVHVAAVDLQQVAEVPEGHLHRHLGRYVVHL